MPAKPKVAFYWCASCGGCEETVLDMADLLAIVGQVEIVFWPVAIDIKRHDIEKLDDGEILASFVNGAIRSSEQEEMARLLRRKSKVVVAFGACAQLGGIPALANLFTRESLFHAAYLHSPATENPKGTVPQTESHVNGHSLELPKLFEAVRTLDDTIDVDYYIPGCPPPPQIVESAVKVLLSGELPPKKTVLAPDQALCEDCKRKDSKPDLLSISEFRRPHQVVVDQEKCLLAQGLWCMGPATRGGCGTPCIDGNMPCTGCLGPTDRVRDQGAKALAGLMSSVEAKDPQAIEKVVQAVPDPIGLLYRYSLAGSVLAHCK